MKRRRKPRPRARRVAYVAACDACAAGVIPGAPEYEPGHRMAPVHLACTSQLQPPGWRRHRDLYGDIGSTDIVCVHIPFADEQPAS